MPMPAFTTVRLMFAVAKRELTSILRGNAERFLFIWTPLLTLPLVTLSLVTVFLMLRTTDILSPARLAVSRSDAETPAVTRIMSDLRSAPDVRVVVVDKPFDVLAQNGCDAVLSPEFGDNTLQLTSNNMVVERIVSRALEAARRRAVPAVLPGKSVSDLFTYSMRWEPMSKHGRKAPIQEVVGALYILAFAYAAMWLIPAIDVVRFDYLHNGIYANLSLPVPMRVVIGGKLLCGLAVTLLPTVLSGVSFAFSAVVALAIFTDYYLGCGLAEGLRHMQRIFDVGPLPLVELSLIPLVVIAGVAFLHAWLMLVVVFLRGHRMSFMLSVYSLGAWAVLAFCFVSVVPHDALWPQLFPLLGLTVCVKQMMLSEFSPVSFLLPVVSTVLGTVFLVVRAGELYSLESWSSRARALRNLRREGVR